MVRRQPMAIVVTAISALLLVLVGAVWTHSESPPTDAEQMSTAVLSDEAPSTDPRQPCTPCHGPEFEFEGPLSEFEGHGIVHEHWDPDRSGDRKPP